MRRAVLFSIGVVLGIVLFFCIESIPPRVQTRDYPNCYYLGASVPQFILAANGCR